MPHDDFGWIAPIYQRTGKYSSLDFLTELMELPVRGRLLDAGGGTGRVSQSLVGKAGQVVVADLSLGMLRVAFRQASLQAVQAQSERLPFPEASFERILMVDAFHHVVDQSETAHELYRVLKAGGLLVIEEPDIHTLGVRLIALGERLLLMRSHFREASRIASLFPSAKAGIRKRNGNVWVIIKKTSDDPPSSVL